VALPVTPQISNIFCGMISVIEQVRNRIISLSPGACFTLKNFQDLQSETGVRTALTRLENEKLIRRLTQGVYEYPVRHKTLGIIPPDISRVAQAIADKNGNRIQPSGAHAANLTGISDQVPGKIVFLTDGPAKTIKIANTEIIFKKATPKMMSAAGTKEGLVIQAIKFMKKENINQAARGRIRKFLEGQSTEDLSKNLRDAPAWIRNLVFEVMEEQK